MTCHECAIKRRRGSRGLSLLEILAVVTIIGVLAVIVIPRFANHSDRAKAKACHVNKGNIETQTQLWLRNKGRWPASDLSDIGAHPDYFPDGLPTCPVDGGSYVLDRTTQRVRGHQH